MVIGQNTEIEKIYKEFYPKIRSYVGYKVADADDAEDVTSEIFKKVVLKYFTFDVEKASVSTWIYTIARNSVVDYYKDKNNPYNKSELTGVEIDLSLDANEQLFRLDNLELITGALQKLSKRERDIIIMRFYYEKKAAEVAELLDMTALNVRIVQFRALTKLKKILQPLRV
ncbi:MAG: RNA polymerase sigma factor [Phocaeicola sp.]